MGAGVRARIRTGAGALDLELTQEGAGALDVVVDGALHERALVADGSSAVHVDLPEGEHEVQVWLPQGAHVWLRSVELDGPWHEPRPGMRWTAYGSSITQCGEADGPSRTWPAIVATGLDWDLTCLGFGGQCHLDPMALRTIAAVPADVVSLCMGINIQGGASYSARTFAAQASAFIEGVRAAHSQAHITVMTPIISPPRETTPDAVGLTLVLIREALAEVMEVLAADDERLHLIHGPDVFGTADGDLAHLPDSLHPDAEGYERMGQRMTRLLGEVAGGA